MNDALGDCRARSQRVIGVLHVGVAVAILSATARQFNLIVGRAPQRDHLGPTPAFPAVRALSNR